MYNVLCIVGYSMQKQKGNIRRKGEYLFLSSTARKAAFPKAEQAKPERR